MPDKLLIPVVLTNRYAKFKADPEVQARLKRFFRYSAPQSVLDNSAYYANGSWNGYHDLLKWSKVGTGLFLLQQQRIADRLEAVLHILDQRQAPKFREIEMGRAWNHQRQAVHSMVKHSRTGGLVLAATGTGKTELAALYFKKLVGYGVFVVDEVFLAEQSQRAMEKVLGEPVGFVGHGVFNPQRITVAIVQTLDRHLEDHKYKPWFKKLEVAIFDEIHMAINERTAVTVEAIQPKAVFGLTASLQLQELSVRLRAINLCGPLIHRYSIVQGQKDSILQQGKVFQIPFENVLAESKYNNSVVRNRDRNNLVQQLVERAVAQNRIVVVMVERRLHLRILHHRLRHIHHEVLSGLVNRQGERAAIIAAMNAKYLPLVIASRVFFKGVDVPQLNTIIDATGLPNENSAIQRFGRGVRKAQNKRDLVYMDISDFTTPPPKPGWETKVESAAQARMNAWVAIGIPVTRLKPGEIPPLL